MPDYEYLYHYLFNSITDALELLDSPSYLSAAEKLRDAQLKAEELFLSQSV